MSEYKITKNGEIVFDKERNLPEKTDNLWVEYIKLEYEILKKHDHITDPQKIERYNTLKKYFEQGKAIDKENAEKSAMALDAARERIKQQMIVNDESPDNSVLYTAITNFKKRNG